MVAPYVKEYVKAAIHRQIENKKFDIIAINQSVPTTQTSLGLVPFSVNLFPNIGIGSKNGERIGYSVNPRKVMIKGHCNLRPYSASTNKYLPVKVKFWICSYKVNNRNAVTLTSTDFDRYFDTAGTSVGFQGNMIDTIADVNKQEWVVYQTKTMTLGQTSVASTSATTLTSYDASRFQVPFAFDVSKHFKSKLEYLDDLPSRPTNRNLFMFVQAVSAEGSSEGGVAIPVELHYRHTFEYEDA